MNTTEHKLNKISKNKIICHRCNIDISNPLFDNSINPKFYSLTTYWDKKLGHYNLCINCKNDLELHIQDFINAHFVHPLGNKYIKATNN